jgi:hypothetical protein
MQDKTLCLLLAGGLGSRLFPLTADRAKPAVPFVRALALHFQFRTSEKYIRRSKLLFGEECGILHVFEQYEGDHGNRVAARFQNNLLTFFSQQLKFPDAPRR